MNDGMKPVEGVSMQKVPVSFETKSMRVFNPRGKFALLVAFLGFWFALSVLFLVLSKFSISVVILSILSLIVGFSWIHFSYFKAGWYGKSLARQRECSSLFSTSSFWGIFNTDTTYPYISYMQNGFKMVAVELIKDTEIGKKGNVKFDHGQSLGEAVGYATSRVPLCLHLDLLEGIGEDSRLSNAFMAARSIENSVQREVIEQLLGQAKLVTMHSAIPTDIIFLYFNSGTDVLLVDLKEILARLMKANYRGLRVLTARDKGNLYKNLFGIQDITAMKSGVSGTTSLRPISINVDGTVTKLNKTTAELNALAEVEMAEKRVKRKRTGIFSRGSNSSDDSDIEL